MFNSTYKMSLSYNLDIGTYKMPSALEDLEFSWTATQEQNEIYLFKAAGEQACKLTKISSATQLSNKNISYKYTTPRYGTNHNIQRNNCLLLCKLYLHPHPSSQQASTLCPISYSK